MLIIPPHSDQQFFHLLLAWLDRTKHLHVHKSLCLGCLQCVTCHLTSHERYQLWTLQIAWIWSLASQVHFQRQVSSRGSRIQCTHLYLLPRSTLLKWCTPCLNPVVGRWFGCLLYMLQDLRINTFHGLFCRIILESNTRYNREPAFQVRHLGHTIL